MNIKMISAVSENGVIGKNNDLPWAGRYKEDMQFFRKMTSNSTVIYGRATLESMSNRLLPKRRNIVITRQKLNGIECYDNLETAIRNASMQLLGEESPPSLPIWLIGGSKIYEEGMRFSDEIFISLIPQTVEGDNLVRFPWIDPSKFQIAEFIALENSDLKVARYVRV